jgi:hypothetical protein
MISVTWKHGYELLEYGRMVNKKKRSQFVSRKRLEGLRKRVKPFPEAFQITCPSTNYSRIGSGICENLDLWDFSFENVML